MTDAMTPIANPFDLDDADAYHAWRDRKLAGYPRSFAELVVEIIDPRRLTGVEHARLVDLCRRANMAVYASQLGDHHDKELVVTLGRRFGLTRLDHNRGADEDAISAIEVQHGAPQSRYIPYTNRPLAWHTDGYYNPPSRWIRSMVLHCVQPADLGGVNELLDPEILYIHLRDRNPDHIRALMHPAAMSIPADEAGARPTQSGPVFLVENGRLQMRYTDRSRSIVWRDDPLLREALEALRRFLREPSPWHFRARLLPGQGILCNNVLHTRSAFEEREHRRLIYRARYHDRITGT